MAEYLCIGVSKYDFKDETTGRTVKGERMTVLKPKPIVGEPDRSGLETSIVPISPEHYAALVSQVPCIVQAEFEPVGKGKLKLTAFNVKTANCEISLKKSAA